MIKDYKIKNKGLKYYTKYFELDELENGFFVGFTPSGISGYYSKGTALDMVLFLNMKEI